MRIEKIYALYKESYKVFKDTRDEAKDAIYFSLKGANFNGNAYAMEALKKGASYAVIDEKQYKVDDRMILVEDALTCLQDLARYHRQQLKVPIIALTGSNGKTTTKELIHVVLDKKFNCYATKGNFNNHIGVPLTLLSITPDHDFGVIEMGANHQHEIEALCNIALPDFGYITNFGRVHLEGFGSFEGVIKGKTEMYRHLKKQGKKVFVNQDDPIQMERTEGMERIVFGSSDGVCKIAFLGADPFVNISFQGMEIKSRLIGNYNFSNIAAAVCIGSYFGVETDKIKIAIEGYIPENNRSQIIHHAGNKIILDAYNANPNSMEAALNNLGTLSDKKKVAVLGDMFELGVDSREEHQNIADQAVKLGLDRIYLIGETFGDLSVEGAEVYQFNSFDAFTDHFKHQSFSKTTFLVKASRGMALERILEYL